MKKYNTTLGIWYAFAERYYHYNNLYIDDGEEYIIQMLELLNDTSLPSSPSSLKNISLEDLDTTDLSYYVVYYNNAYYNLDLLGNISTCHNLVTIVSGMSYTFAHQLSSILPGSVVLNLFEVTSMNNSRYVLVHKGYWYDAGGVYIESLANHPYNLFKSALSVYSLAPSLGFDPDTVYYKEVTA